MDILKKLFPLSFISKDLKPFIISLVIYVVAEAVCGCVIGFLASLPILKILGIIFSVLGSLLGLYALGGIVLSILVFLKVIK